MCTLPANVTASPIAAPAESESSAPRTGGLLRSFTAFLRGFEAVAVRPVGDPRKATPHYIGERRLFIGGKVVSFRRDDVLGRPTGLNGDR